MRPGRPVTSVLVLCVAAASTGVAQAHRTTLGIMAGSVFAKMGGADVGLLTKTRVGFAVGGFVSIGVSRNLAIEPQVFFVQKGAKGTTGNVDVAAKLSYVEVPLLLIARAPAKNGGILSPHVYAGPAIAFKTGCTIVPSEGATQTCGDEPDNKVKRVDLSLGFGGGVDVGRATIDVRYDLGFTKLSDAGRNEDVKNRAFYLIVGWGFRLPR